MWPEHTKKWGIPVTFSLFPIIAISICYIPDNVNVSSHCRDNEMTCIWQILLCWKSTALKLTWALIKVIMRNVSGTWDFHQANPFLLAFLTDFSLNVFFKVVIMQCCITDITNNRKTKMFIHLRYLPSYIGCPWY